MKTFCQYINEREKLDTREPGTFGHFNHHLAAFYNHRARAYELRGSDDQGEKEHMEAAKYYENVLKQHYGRDKIEHVIDHLWIHDDASRARSWEQMNNT